MARAASDAGIKKWMVVAPSILLPDALVLSDDVDLAALETNLAVRGGEQRIVPAHTDVRAGEEFRAALPDDDRSGLDGLAAKQFHASVLGVAISSVPRGALSFFMCHDELPFIHPNLKPLPSRGR
jgi:hypothetical protein